MNLARVFAVLAIVLGLSAAGTASGQLSNGQQQAVVALHAQPHNGKGWVCSGLDPGLPCDQYTTTWPVGYGTDVYFVVANADSALGVGGASFGVDYGNTPGVQADGQGVDVFGFLSCVDQTFLNGIDPGDPATDFPAAGGGARLLWDVSANCQRHEVAPYGVHALACVVYVYAYSPDLFIVDMNRNESTGPEFQVVDCLGPALSDLSWPDHAGVVGFGTTGYNPCNCCVDDFFPPYLTGASGAGNTNLVTVLFDEPVYLGADAPSNYMVYPTADPSAPLGVSQAGHAGSTVTLTLASNLAAGVSYTVKVSNVADAYGNSISPNATISFTASGAVPTERTTWGGIKTRYR